MSKTYTLTFSEQQIDCMKGIIDYIKDDNRDRITMENKLNSEPETDFCKVLKSEIDLCDYILHQISNQQEVKNHSNFSEVRSFIRYTIEHDGWYQIPEDDGILSDMANDWIEHCEMYDKHPMSIDEDDVFNLCESFELETED